MSTVGQISYLVAIFAVLVLNHFIIKICYQHRNQLVSRYIMYATLLSSAAVISWLGINLAPNRDAILAKSGHAEVG